MWCALGQCYVSDQVSLQDQAIRSVPGGSCLALLLLAAGQADDVVFCLLPAKATASKLAWVHLFGNGSRQVLPEGHRVQRPRRHRGPHAGERACLGFGVQRRAGVRGRDTILPAAPYFRRPSYTRLARSTPRRSSSTATTLPGWTLRACHSGQTQWRRYCSWRPITRCVKKARQGGRHGGERGAGAEGLGTGAGACV